MKVLVIIATPSKNNVMTQCLESLRKQDYSNYEILINEVKPINKYPDRRNVSFNSTNNHNLARKKALKSDADYFLFADDDMIFPENTISELVLQAEEKRTTIPVLMPDGKLIPIGTLVPKKHIIGGWYKMIDSPFYVTGKWIADNTFWNFTYVRSGLTQVDMVGLGCMLISREALKRLKFHTGIDKFCKVNNGQRCYIGPCVQFGNDAIDKGYTLWMDGNIVCTHERRKQ